ncbi:hypothetical protein EN933_05435 [Mesorhizobium sp. M7A.F.Ca.US.001.01.1.1]|nr:hypothetical protein EN933_05435 [Mesorhizobium sp. M7A.F.Ca.US.001.01.1.1]
MNSSTKQALDVVAAELERLLNGAKNDAIRVKLQNLNDVCYHLVVVGKQRLTVPEVIAAYAARVHSPSQSIAESSIRNKRGGANPFQKLYRVWESASKGIRSPKPRHVWQGGAVEIVADEDVEGISDNVLKHRVSLLVAQNRSYKSQLEILQQVRGAPVITLPGQSLHSDERTQANHLVLTEAEIEAVKNFTSDISLRARGLKRIQDGGIATLEGRRLADAGFMEALQKIVESYKADW